MKNYYSVSPATGKPTGIKGYDYDDESITIYFTSGSIYTYTYGSCGAGHVESMKQLADSQDGLNTYTTKNKPPFASKR